MKILAIDQGTTSTRALLYQEGALTPVMQRAHRQILPAPGHVEHDPAELLASLNAALQTKGDLVALANQGESCLGWDARDCRPISPIIVWQDDRTAPDTARLAAAGAGPEVMARAGLPLDPYFSASKLGWIMRNCPEAAANARQGWLRLGTTDAFFRDRLTGRFQTDIATASRTSLMNIETGGWDASLCEIFGVPLAALPEITPTGGDLGRLPNGARLAVSIVDQQAALFGHGCHNPGTAKVTFGTGAFVQCVTEGLIRPEQPGPLPTVAWQLPGHCRSATALMGRSIRRRRRLIGPDRWVCSAITTPFRASMPPRRSTGGWPSCPHWRGWPARIGIAQRGARGSGWRWNMPRPI